MNKVNMFKLLKVARNMSPFSLALTATLLVPPSLFSAFFWLLRRGNGFWFCCKCALQ